MPIRKKDEERTAILNTFRSNLTELMTNKGVDNTTLCTLTGISYSDLTKYRNQEYNALPSIPVLSKICKFFNVSFDYMIGLDPGGKYSQLSEDEKNLLSKYQALSDRDKKLIQMILSSDPEETEQTI